MKYKFFYLIFATLLLSACGSEGRYQLAIITEGNHVIAGDTLGDLIVFGGHVTLDESSQLVGSAHMLSGVLEVQGEIQGDISQFGGTLVIGPQAIVSGKINHGGGESSVSKDAVIAGGLNSGTGLKLPSLTQAQTQNTAGGFIRLVLASLIIGLLAFLLDCYIPLSLNHVSDAAQQNFIVCSAMGVLVTITGASLLVLLAYTIVLIPVAIVGLLLMGSAVLFSWVAWGSSLGRRLVKHFKLNISSGLTAFLGGATFILMLNLFTMIPWVGGYITLIFAITGLGAVFLTRFGIRRFTPADLSGTSE
jgi:hypothetical protein